MRVKARRKLIMNSGVFGTKLDNCGKISNSFNNLTGDRPLSELAWGGTKQVYDRILEIRQVSNQSRGNREVYRTNRTPWKTITVRINKK